MIEFRNISKTFNKNSPNEVRALENFSLEIGDGEFVILIGTNGSGKSTVLNLLSGTILPDEGTILLDQQNITSLKEYERSKWIARIFQDPLAGTSPELTVLENFRLASLRGKSKTLNIGTGKAFRSMVKELVSSLGSELKLDSKLDQSMGSLSGGQRQALTLLMATMNNSKVLLLDEPAAALDPKTAHRLMELSERIILENKLTAIMVTHQVKDIIRYGSRVIQLIEGKQVRDMKGEDKAKLSAVEVVNWF
ncbi:MAG: ATP-binding cassette domain-containing protein [Bacteroidia bacterium]